MKTEDEERKKRTKKFKYRQKTMGVRNILDRRIKKLIQRRRIYGPLITPENTAFPECQLMNMFCQKIVCLPRMHDFCIDYRRPCSLVQYVRRWALAEMSKTALRVTSRLPMQ